MSLALIREHADVKEEFERLTQHRNQQLMASIIHMIDDVKEQASSYMMDNDFSVIDKPAENMLHGVYKHLRITIHYPDAESCLESGHCIFEVCHNYRTMLVGATLRTGNNAIYGGFIAYRTQEGRIRKEIESLKTRIDHLKAMGVSEINSTYSLGIMERRNGVALQKRRVKNIVEVIDEIIQ